MISRRAGIPGGGRDLLYVAQSRFRVAALLGVTALMLSGCGVQVTPRGPRNPVVPGGDGTQPRGPGRQLPGSGDLRGNRQVEAVQRRVCRGAAVPGGYVAVDYVNSTECGTVGDSAHVYNAIVVTDLVNRSRVTTIVICTGQKIPSGWERLGNDEVTSQCRRSSTDQPSAENTIQIIKKF
jgi:hypothetical protein